MKYFSPTAFAILCVILAGRMYKVLSSKRYRAYSSMALLVVIVGGLYGVGVIGKNKVEAMTYSGKTNGTLDGMESYYFDNSKDIVFFKVDGGYTIQVGSYQQEERAEKCAEEKKKVLSKTAANVRSDVRIEEMMNNNGVFFRVRIGKFASLDEAKDFSEKLK